MFRVKHHRASSGPVAVLASAVMRDRARICSISVEADKTTDLRFLEFSCRRPKLASRQRRFFDRAIWLSVRRTFPVLRPGFHRYGHRALAPGERDYGRD